MYFMGPGCQGGTFDPEQCNNTFPVCLTRRPGDGAPRGDPPPLTPRRSSANRPPQDIRIGIGFPGPGSQDIQMGTKGVYFHPFLMILCAIVMVFRKDSRSGIRIACFQQKKAKNFENCPRPSRDLPGPSRIPGSRVPGSPGYLNILGPRGSRDISKSWVPGPRTAW